MKKISGSLKAAIGIAALCGGFLSQQVGAASVVEIDGSSTVYPITEAVAEEYQAAGGAPARAAASSASAAARPISPTPRARS